MSHLEVEMRHRLEGKSQLRKDSTYLVDWFFELDSARQSSGFGIQPITYTEMSAWAGLRGIELFDWEVKVLRSLDRTRIADLQGTKKPDASIEKFDRLFAG